ncbi:hypothetical protein EJ06DRAFT_433779 [Trichodelitschia bisporula]|uniref:Myosin-binding domain-containing protein n=1 Tax=Trichodelitschia bisporula TaxID=703511 RepID=A0A6G1HWY4_9PEZI|nr:hypothetical protein EJ06DRAFT_433779 [Trichodelitschia bisporula]
MFVNSRLGRADNSKFLEHFRYIIVASQLLNEQYGHGGLRASSLPSQLATAQLGEFNVASTSVRGAIVTAAIAFGIVWLIHWSRGGRLGGFSRGRLSIIVSVFLVLAVVLYAYARRQWLQYLRKNAVSAASTLVTNLQAFDSSSSAALMLIQEVELVSRGYRISNPLPPITRLEERGQTRRCGRLRRCLRGAFSTNIPPLLEACGNLRELISEDDLEKYLDIYDINDQDIQEAYHGFSLSEFEDLESLKALRILQARLTVLRRVFLCSLLSLEADGGKPDFARWRTAVDAMESMASISGSWAEKINLILNEEESFNLVSSPSIKRQSFGLSAGASDRDRFRSQIRKLGTLSSGIRGLQAKLQILREESSKVFEGDPGPSSDTAIADLAPSVLAQYDSIGSDLKSLLQAWESGKTSLALSLEKHAADQRRISGVADLAMRSPAPSLGGRTAVEEGDPNGSPLDALRALEGLSRSSSNHSASHSHGSSDDAEVFEGIAIPRIRPSREERLARMAEDRERAASARERREAGMSLIRELENVISQRPSAVTHPRGPGSRITSI